MVSDPSGGVGMVRGKLRGIFTMQLVIALARYQCAALTFLMVSRLAYSHLVKVRSSESFVSSSSGALLFQKC